MSFSNLITHETNGIVPRGPSLTVNITGWPATPDDDDDDDEPVPVPVLPPTATGGLFVLLTGIALRARRVGR